MKSRVFPVAAVVTCLSFFLLTACKSDKQQSAGAGTPVSGTPTPTAQGAQLNITRADYEQAVARWQAQGIREYEMQVDFIGFSDFMGSWILDVQSDGRHGTVISYTLDPAGIQAPMRNEMPTSAETARISAIKEGLQDLTIEATMEGIDSALSKGTQVTGIWNVQFGPLEAPTNVDVQTDSRGGEPWTWTLKSLKVVKSDTPTSTP